jgi:nitroreductase
MDLLEGIRTRRSIRDFKNTPVSRDTIMEIIEAGAWAPSGLNNQPWRFVTVVDRNVLDSLAGLTKYSRIITEAPACIAAFLDKDAMYHEAKDHQAIGACLQNMLLAAHALGLGAVWLGEILRSAESVRTLFSLPDTLELMAVVALGYPSKPPRKPVRRPLTELILKEI